MIIYFIHMVKLHIHNRSRSQKIYIWCLENNKLNQRNLCFCMFNGLAFRFDSYLVELKHEGRIYFLSLWDTAGQDDYDKVRPLAYPLTVMTHCILTITSICSNISDGILLWIIDPEPCNNSHIWYGMIEGIILYIANAANYHKTVTVSTVY